MSADWILETRRGGAHELHHAPWPDPLRPTVWLLEPLAPAVVLGSAQRDDDLASAAVAEGGLEVVRRRSGGGAVLLDPEAIVWLDVFVPRDHALWDDDVHGTAVRVGEAWVDALAMVGRDPRPLAVHRGGVVDRALGSVACFASLGPGEVTDGGAKLVGLSQRRTRAGARVQGLVHRHGGAADLVPLLARHPAGLAEALAGVGVAEVRPAALAEALVTALAARAD